MCKIKMELAIDVPSALMAITLMLLVGLCYRYNNIHSFWKQRNIKGPKPHFIFGNFIQLLSDGEFTKKCTKHYGRTHGIYEGYEPVLVIADAQLARQICIKDFDIFPNHKLAKFINKYNAKFLFTLQDDHWRRVRALVSPTFTSGKMRKMVRLLDKCVDDLIGSFDETIVSSSSGQVAKVDLKETYQLYTMDSLSTCCYSLKLERVRSARNLKILATCNELVSQAMELLNYSFMRVLLMVLVNEKILEFINFEALPLKQIQPLVSKISKLIEDRRKSGRKFDDLLQSLLDARLTSRIVLDEFDAKENHHAAMTNESIRSDQEKLSLGSAARENKTPNHSHGFMDDEEILANAVNFMTAGIESTASLLANCTYSLAFHKNVQEALRNEIRKIATFDQANETPLFDYDAITSCLYLDAVVSETLRLMSPAAMTDRVCNQDYYIEQCNVTLPKGSKVYLEWSCIMTDAEYWPNPLRFNPDRFMPENRDKIMPGSYCPFGLGSRHCVGMRFSLTQAKLALAKLLMNFEFEPALGTSFPPKAKPIFIGLRNFSTSVNIKRLANRK